MRGAVLVRRDLTTADGNERICTVVVALIDTNILVYRYDFRFPDKQRIAHRLLARGVEMGTLCLPHQAIVEFVAATTRPRPDLDGCPLLAPHEAYREAEELFLQFTVLFPNEDIVRIALRGAATYQLSWFDAHLWAYAEFHRLPELLSEDFQHQRTYGLVRVVNPFIDLVDVVHEPVSEYDPAE